jgi:hypothetical protein
LNAGGDFVTTGTLTYGANSKLVFNRSYTLTGSSKIWGTGLTASNIAPTIEIQSGTVATNDTLYVKRRVNLLGGTLGSGSITKIKLAPGDTVFKCGGNFASTPVYGTNITTLYCAPQPGNPPAILGAEMPAGGFTGDVIISTNLVLGANIKASGNIIVTNTGVLNDSNFIVSQATSVNVQSGGTIITDKTGGLTGPNSLLGTISTTLSPTSTVIYDAPSGTQTVSQGIAYGNLILTQGSAKTFSPGIITITGNFTVDISSGTVTCVPGSTLIFSGTNQQVSGLNYYNVQFGGSGTCNITSTASVTANMDISPGSGIIVNTNNHLTLLSGPTGTAQIGPLLNGSRIIGNVCWQRYIPGGPSNRRWRFLSNPILNVSFRWWQNDIFITGPGTGGVPCSWNTTSTTSMTQNSNGFDQNQSAVNSCFTWNEPTGAWKTIPRTFDTINPLVAYRTFVRGNRNIEGCLLMTRMPDSVSSVTLHSCGPIVQGTQTATLTKTAASSGSGWNYVSNPYPCSVNWWDPNWIGTRSASISPTIYIWIPQLSQYATWNPYSGGVNGGSNIIGTGQSFFIQTSASTSLVFQEAYKVDSGQIGFFGKTSTAAVSNNLKISLTGAASQTNDQTVCYLYRGTTLNIDNPYDGLKMGYTPGGIASATKVNSTKLVFNAIPPVTTADTIVLFTYTSATGDSYTLNFNGAATFDPQYTLLLRDKYLGTVTNLTYTKTYAFTTSATASASFDENRFEIIIMNAGALPVTLSEFNAARQSEKTVMVTWSTASEVNNSHFIVEHSLDGQNFAQLGIVKGSGTSSSIKNYSYLHTSPVLNTVNYYRLTQVDKNNATSQSYVVAVNMDEQKAGTVSVFPVPATSILNINFEHSQFAGNVVVKVVDLTGKELITNAVSLKGNSQVVPVDVSQLASGAYFVSVSSGNTEQMLKFIKN